MFRLNFENCGRIFNFNTNLILLATCVLPASYNFGQAKHGQKGPVATFCQWSVCCPMRNDHQKDFFWKIGSKGEFFFIKQAPRFFCYKI